MEERIMGVVQKIDMRNKTENEVVVLYKVILEQITQQKIEVTVGTISDGKYGVQVSFNGRLFWLISKAWDTVTEITINVLSAINELKLI